MQYFIKILVILVIIIAITEVAKKNQLAAAVLASLPITSIIAIFWLKYENSDPEIIITLCQNVFWMVIPSLLFFIIFPALLSKKYNFSLAFFVSVALTSSAYILLLKLLSHFKRA